MPWIDVTEWHQHANGGGWVFKDATVAAKAYIGELAVVTGSAWVTGSARVDGSARVTGSAWVFSPLYIQGSVHPITVSSHTEVSVGCKKHTIGWWMDHYAEVGRGEGYTDIQIAEYGALLAAVKVWMETMLPKEVKP